MRRWVHDPSAGTLDTRSHGVGEAPASVHTGVEGSGLSCDWGKIGRGRLAVLICAEVARAVRLCEA